MSVIVHHLELCRLMNNNVFFFECPARKIRAQRYQLIGHKGWEWNNERKEGFCTDVDFGLSVLSGSGIAGY